MGWLCLHSLKLLLKARCCTLNFKCDVAQVVNYIIIGYIKESMKSNEATRGRCVRSSRVKYQIYILILCFSLSFFSASETDIKNPPYFSMTLSVLLFSSSSSSWIGFAFVKDSCQPDNEMFNVNLCRVPDMMHMYFSTWIYTVHLKNFSIKLQKLITIYCKNSITRLNIVSPYNYCPRTKLIDYDFRSSSLLQTI